MPFGAEFDAVDVGGFISCSPSFCHSVLNACLTSTWLLPALPVPFEALITGRGPKTVITEREARTNTENAKIPDLTIMIFLEKRPTSRHPPTTTDQKKRREPGLNIRSILRPFSYPHFIRGTRKSILAFGELCTHLEKLIFIEFW